MYLKATIMGCGSSGGVPRIGGHWGACNPENPRNRRSRCSLLVQRGTEDTFSQENSTNILVDTSPDMRYQLATTTIKTLDGVLYTHDHADQVHGIDDLRMIAINQRRRVDTYIDEATQATLVQRFGYCFEAPKGSPYPPILEKHTITPWEDFVVEGKGGKLAVRPFLQDHGSVDSLGFRFGPIAYSSDLVGLPEESFAALEGVDTWIVGALRYTPHPNHAHLDLTLKWIERLKPRLSILTNMHVDMDYDELCRTLPKNVVPGYDGMALQFSSN